MDIETADKFSDWLKTQTQETCVIIAARAALRVFPIVIHSRKAVSSIVLLTARAILTSGVAAKMATLEVREAAFASADAAFAAGREIAHDARATSNVIRAAAGAASSANATDTALATYAAINNANAAAVAIDATVTAAAYSDYNASFEMLFQTPLWDAPNEPERLVSALLPNENLLESGQEWAFWREWYQGFLDGNPMDWELQRRVALIADPIWEAGPEAVAEEIERIRAAFEVETRAGDLREAAFVATAPSRGIGDNNSPDSIDDAFKTQDGVTIIWAAARDLEQEAASDRPNLERVRKAIGAIFGVMKSVGLWAAKKVDKALTAFVVTAGAAGGTASIAWLTQHSDKIGELIEAAERWLKLMQ